MSGLAALPRRPARRGAASAHGRPRPARSRPALLVLLLAGVLAGLALAALRVDGIRARYALGVALREEEALREARRQWVAEIQRLRDPKRLASLARERGLAAPERVRELP